MAALWIAIQTTTEIAVTDMTLVRTFAEEVYSQTVLPDLELGALSAEHAVARAAAIAIPPMALSALVMIFGMRWLERRVPPPDQMQVAQPLIRLGRARWPLAIVVAASVVGTLAVPIGSLVAKTGSAGSPPAWTASTAWAVLSTTAIAHGRVLLDSLAVAAAVGILSAAIAGTAAWLARDSRWLRALLVLFAAFCWAAPGPMVGFGLSLTIQDLVDWESKWNGHALSNALYHGPSHVPVIWASFVRLWPFALALSWPAIRAVPGELIDAARVDGATPSAEFRLAILPVLAPALRRAALAVAVLTLGELSASKTVATAQGQTLAHDIFAQMHYGVTPTVAAQCLLLLALVLPIVLCLEATPRRRRPYPA